MPTVERFPLSFKTQFSGSHFCHIVLGVHSGGRFGALGISRREDLMYKPLEYKTLTDLVQEFQVAYRRYWHTLCKVKIGHYVSHDPHSVEQIEWKHSVLDVDKLSKEELRKELERHTRDMRLKVRMIHLRLNHNTADSSKLWVLGCSETKVLSSDFIRNSSQKICLTGIREICCRNDMLSANVKVKHVLRQMELQKLLFTNRFPKHFYCPSVGCLAI